MTTINSPERGFTTAEFESRTERAQARMAEQNLGGLLLSTEAELRYFTGFQTLFWQSPTRPWFLFVPAQGKPVAIIPEIGAALMGKSWVDDIRTWSAPAPEDDGISLLCEVLTPLVNAKQTLGIPKGHETLLRMPLGDWEQLLQKLPGLVIGDATSLVQGLRRVKSKAEIEKLAHICGIGSRAFAQVPEFLTQGLPLEEAFRSFRRLALQLGVDDVPYLVGGAGQGGYGDVISPPGATPLRAGDVVMMDTGCTWDGYFCDFDRNWAIGQADDASRRVYDVLWRATEAGLEAAKAGNTCRDLFDAMSVVIDGINVKQSNDEGSVGRLGHGLGMQLTEQPSIAAFDNTLLEENMVMTLEPSLCYGDGLMMVHEENIVITPNGAHLLTERAPAELTVVS